jgi:hypothetical protein
MHIFMPEVGQHLSITEPWTFRIHNLMENKRFIEYTGATGIETLKDGRSVLWGAEPKDGRLGNLWVDDRSSIYRFVNSEWHYADTMPHSWNSDQWNTRVTLPTDRTIVINNIHPKRKTYPTEHTWIEFLCKDFPGQGPLWDASNSRDRLPFSTLLEDVNLLNVQPVSQ